MSQHPYEYKILVEYLNPLLSFTTPHFAKETDEQSLLTVLQDVVAHLPESIEEGWEVNSHGLTVAENTVILTVLLQRHRV